MPGNEIWNKYKILRDDFDYVLEIPRILFFRIVTRPNRVQKREYVEIQE